MPLLKKTKVFSLAFFILFLFFSSFVYFGGIKTTDLKITQIVQAHIPRIFDIPFSIFSLLGSLEITLILFLLLTYFLYKRGYVNAYLVLVLFALGSAFESVGKFFLYHPAPPSTYFRTIGFIFPSKYIHTDFSYPSGHIFRTFLLAVLFIFFFSKKRSMKSLIFIVVLISLVMAISRLYLGEHWFSDVIGGMLLALSFSFLTISFLSKKRFNQKQ